ncbi:MAG: hypothetical protein M1814_000459 [Vezdaea aestivalis]|nr:MAG: hypothetical protein M1814_000459 [Vezdaea aestivalis]
MLLPKGGVNWKSAKSRLPPTRAVLSFLSKPRVLISLTIAGIIILLWRGISSSAREMQQFYCWGPAKPPKDMTANEMSDWSGSLQTPVLFNHHEPITINDSTITNIKLDPIHSTPKGADNQERVLLLTPVRNAAHFLAVYFDRVSQLTYPHNLIDLAFLVSDSNDDTLALLSKELERIQKGPEKDRFRSAMVVEKDFGVKLAQNVEDRHGFAAQGPRRKALGRARNYLLSTALKPDHSWVYWRDVDIHDSPVRILEDFIVHDKDILVPNIWFHRYKDGRDIEGKFDYNSWIESDKGLALSSKLDKDVVLAEGYKEYVTGRTYLATMGDWRNNKDEEVALDGIGGVNILVKADVHRSGINFPCYAFENQAETEGFAKMAKRAGYQVVGLPNYVVWHVDTEEKPGNA